MADENKPTTETSQQPAAACGQPAASETNTPKKTSWPELVGLIAEEAEKKVKIDMPEAYVQVIQPGQPVTKDLRQDRVRLFVDSTGKVESTPVIG